MTITHVFFDIGGTPLARAFGAFLDGLAAPAPGSIPVAPPTGHIP